MTPLFKTQVRVCNLDTKRCFKSRPGIGLDTGATKSFIDPSSAATIEAKTGKMRMKPGVAGTANGAARVFHEDAIRLCLLQGRKKACIRGLLVIPSKQNVDIMLGADFLRKNRCKIDMPKKSLRCRKLGVRFK